jgi:DUF971 family protein
MKKAIMFGAVVGIVILALGVAGFAYARTLSPMRGAFQQDADEAYPYGRGMMDSGYGRGMMGQGVYDEREGLLHDYMSQAIADEFGLTVEELDALHDSGETLWDYAQEQGISQDEFFSRMQAARSEALAQAVADEVITQEQADWMLNHMGQGMGGGWGMRGQFGEGEGPLYDYMAPAMAEAFGLTLEELEALHDSGETLWDYAQEQGMSEEEFLSLKQSAQTEALNQAEADGVITQEQADRMAEHMGQGFGEGGCHGGFGPGSFGPGMRGPGGRWNSQP